MIFGHKKPEINYTTRPGAYGIILDRKSDKIGIIKAGSGYYLAGGGIEAKEDTFEALERELCEEVGYTISWVDYIGRFTQYFESIKDGIHYEILGFVFTIYLESFVQPAIELDHELVWVSKDEAIGLLKIDYQKEAVRRL